MAHQWSDVKKLIGRKIATLDRHKPFEILTVIEQTVIIKVHSTDQERSIAREEVEGALKALDTLGQISRSDIQEEYSPRNPAYVAAILAALPDVKYTVRPIVLRLARS